MNKTIIITAGTSAQSQALAKSYPNDHIVFADSLPVPKPLLDSGRFVQLPAITAHHFIHELLKVCLDQDASLLVIQSEAEVAIIAPQKLLFEEYNIEIKC